MQHQLEVRNITKKISELNCKLDVVSTLSEPRENSYIEYIVEGLDVDEVDCSATDNEPLFRIGQAALNLGEIKTSKTFPSLCRYQNKQLFLLSDTDCQMFPELPWIPPSHIWKWLQELPPLITMERYKQPVEIQLPP